MNVQFLPPADLELKAAVEYYEDQLQGLGAAFYDEVIKAADYISRFPEGWQKIGKNTRKFILKRFPYLLLYIYEDNNIFITAVAHQHRNPDYYIDRI